MHAVVAAGFPGGGLWGEPDGYRGGSLASRPGAAWKITWTAMLCRTELAGAVSREQGYLLYRIGSTVRTSSSKPRVVLRKLMEDAAKEYGWVAPVEVLRAAGMRIPKSV